MPVSFNDPDESVFLELANVDRPHPFLIAPFKSATRSVSTSPCFSSFSVDIRSRPRIFSPLFLMVSVQPRISSSSLTCLAISSSAPSMAVGANR